MPLTDTEVRKAILDRPYILADERGLYLRVNPSGSRLWRFKYRVTGVDKLLSLGIYRDTSLQKALAKRDVRTHVSRVLWLVTRRATSTLRPLAGRSAVQRRPWPGGVVTLD